RPAVEAHGDGVQDEVVIVHDGALEAVLLQPLLEVVASRSETGSVVLHWSAREVELLRLSGLRRRESGYVSVVTRSGLVDERDDCGVGSGARRRGSVAVRIDRLRPGGADAELQCNRERQEHEASMIHDA